jgi:hypothetical protein
MRLDLRSIAEAAAHDPAKPLWDAAGDLSDYEIFHNLILVATYIAPEKVGNIIMPDRRLDEDRFQGKIGLVLKVGPTAFVDDGATKFGGFELMPGQWVIYRPSDGYELFIRDRRKANEGLSCRLIEDVFVRGRVSDPGLIY